MVRTKNRALVTRKVSPFSAITYAVVLGMLGFFILLVFVNLLVASLCFFALFSYVVLYGWGKRHTVHGTLIGSFPGAIPPVAGYAAVTGRIDAAAVTLFLILVFWQMPHFYAIAMYRYEDYKRAGLPVLTVEHGMRAARLQIYAYIVGFIAAASALFAFGYTGYIYLAGAVCLGIYWLWRGFFRLRGLSDEIWGRKMFLTSLIINLGISFFIAVGALLP